MVESKHWTKKLWSINPFLESSFWLFMFDISDEATSTDLANLIFSVFAYHIFQLWGCLTGSVTSVCNTQYIIKIHLNSKLKLINPVYSFYKGTNYLPFLSTTLLKPVVWNCLKWKYNNNVWNENYKRSYFLKSLKSQTVCECPNNKNRVEASQVAHILQHLTRRFDS